jgi:tetratricopeptide (TPR) repeat protein
MAVTVGLMLALRMKDAPSPNAGKAPQTEAGRPSATEIAADRRHEAMALQAELQKKPTHVPILFRLAQLARESGKPAEAIPHLRKILDLEPKNTEARLELGRDLYDTGNVTDALKETNQILIENPKNPDALYNMGAIYANSSQPDAARQYWRRAVASDPASDSGKRAAESLPRLSGSHK